MCWFKKLLFVRIKLYEWNEYTVICTTSKNPTKKNIKSSQVIQVWNVNVREIREKSGKFYWLNILNTYMNGDELASNGIYIIAK